MRILQVRTSHDIAFFGGLLRDAYELRSYDDPYAPAVFYGCYRAEDLEALRRHQSLAVLLWGGSDAMNVRMLRMVANLPRTRRNPLFHIAPSSFIARDLDQVGISYRRLNIYPGNRPLFRPVPLGNKVYFYIGSRRPDRFEFYGGPYLELMQRALPGVEFILGQARELPYEIMPAIYAQCAVGLRLVPHDAGSCTVVEMGLMGRKVIWNGGFPNAIPYRSINDVVRAIRGELERAGETDRAIAREVKRALADTAWLKLKTYRQSAVAASGASYRFEAQRPVARLI